jgi:mercuric ion transport protein
MTVRDEATVLRNEAMTTTRNQFGGAALVADDRAKGGASRLLAAGGILAALGAASCCVIPFALFALGVSGAWIGNLSALEPYQPLFAVLALGFIGYGAYRVYAKPKAICVPGSYCADPKSDRLAKIGLWAATGLVIVAVGFPYLIRAIAF